MLRFCIAAAAALSALATAAQAQTYPTSPVMRLRLCCDDRERAERAGGAKAKLAAQGTEVFQLPPKAIAAYVQTAAKRLTDLIKSANIQGE